MKFRRSADSKSQMSEKTDSEFELSEQKSEKSQNKYESDFEDNSVF